jgi:hypothetical protein
LSSALAQKKRNIIFGMRHFFEVLELRGISSEADLPVIELLNKRDVFKLYEELYSSISTSQHQEASQPNTGLDSDPFNFLASASIRGDSTCQAARCRSIKLDFLARFSALYATEVSVPVILSHPDKVDSATDAKRLLGLASLTLLRFHPLITNGIVKPITLITTHCKHVLPIVTQMNSFVRLMADGGAKEFQNEFKAIYQRPEKSPSGRSTIYLEGPPEFLEHGSMIFLFDEQPGWAAKSWRYDADGMVEIRGPKKLRLVETVFNRIASDTSFYLAYGRQRRARLLTDLPGDTLLLDWLTDDESIASTSTALRYLDHSLPLLSELPIGTLVRIRRQERDSFEMYRNTIKSLTAEIVSSNAELSEDAAKDAFRSKLQPQIARLRAESALERKRQRRRIVGGVSALAAAVGIGAFAALPLLVKGVLAASATAVGTSLTTKAAASACEHGADLRQGNELFFLLQLINEATAL